MSLYTEPFSVILSVAGPRQDGSEVTPATLATLAASEVPIPIAFGRATVGEIERLELEEREGKACVVGYGRCLADVARLGLWGIKEATSPPV